MENAHMILGWKEWVSLPDLGLPGIKAKIDTGAATSSIHAYNIKYVVKGGQKYVKFDIHPIQKNNKISKSCMAKLVDKRHVRSSSGDKQRRPVVITQLRMGNYEWEIQLNLTNRDSMGMRMLIGREALVGRGMVDPTHKFLHGKVNTKRLYKDYK
ncbi:MAG: ATP-dependent zinc protease [Rickettsiales bacterium]